jgi:hypothetical protein
MFLLTTFRRDGRVEKEYDKNEDQLYKDALHHEAMGQVWAWRIVNLDSGKCTLYWKEGEDKHAPCYR